MNARLGLVAGAASHIAAWSLLAYGGYSAALAVAGMLRGLRGTEAAPDAALPRMLAVVPAHDEEAVIEQIVADLVGQDYPEGRLSVLVVADHCGDRTAELATRAGARAIDRRRGARGKSAALRDAVALAVEESFDAIAVFDADNRVPEGFLRRLGERLARGEVVVQGRVDAKNPTRSWVAGASALGFLGVAALQQEPRERLGLSAPLMGTGWAGRLDTCAPLLRELETLTDDLELSAHLAERGIRVAYERDAVLLDEKPVALRTATLQRHRWMQGRWHVASRHVPALARVALDRGRAPGERVRAADVGVQILGPSLLFSAVALGLVGGVAWPLRRRGYPAPPPARTMAAALLLYALPAPFIARLSPPRTVWRFYAIQPLYLVLSVPLSISGYVRRAETSWRRTPHGA